VDEGSLTITPDMSVYIVGEAGKNTTDIETFSDQIESKKNDQK